MRQTLRFGRVAGVQVGIHWSVFVIALLLVQSLATVLLPASAPDHSVAAYWLVATVTAVVFLASLLAHELAHALVARYHRMRVDRVTLWLLGGMAELGDRPPTPRVDLQVAAVGPLTSLVAGGAFLTVAVAGAGVLPALWLAALAWLAGINVLLAVFNLLPAAPLDGGRILRAALWRRWNDRARAQIAAAGAGRLLGGVLIAVGIVEILVTGTLSGLWLALIGWFLLGAAEAERRDAQLSGQAYRVPVRAVMIPLVALPTAAGTGPPAVHLATRGGTVDADCSVAEAMPILAARHGPVFVVDHGTLVGVLTEDAVRHVADGRAQRPAGYRH